jgi:dTDP-4-amino-4,6-dideoxygalactose transaminase
LSINVTRSFLPPKEEFQVYLDKIYETNWLTNNGPLLLDLEQKIKDYCNLQNFIFVTNGTIALQLAIKALELSGEIITTPYSYCATTTSILWENCQPVFADINEVDFNINADLIESKITKKTSAILATHVYGNPCDVLKIAEIAKKYNLAIIYDAAHAFNVQLNGKSLLSYGDISTCSFHATKVFHTVEGGAIVINNNQELHEKTLYLRSFGHSHDNDYRNVGINAKNSEFHAAMGLANLPHIKEIISKRKVISDLYDSLLNFSFLYKPQTKEKDFIYNYSYYPILFQNPEVTNLVIKELNNIQVFPRRYFYPSLNTLHYLSHKDSCPISESITQRVLSLPLYPDLPLDNVKEIVEIINRTVNLK